MKLLPGPFGWASVGELSHVTLELVSGPRPIDYWERSTISQALYCHSCPVDLYPRILSCLEHSLYQCLMRPGVTAEVLRCGCLTRAGVAVSYRLFGTDLAHQLAQLPPKTPLAAPP